MGERIGYNPESDQRALLARERASIVESPEVRRNPYYHPILTKTQEQILFRQMRQDNTNTVALLQNEQFMAEIKLEEREKWAYVFATQENVHDIIVACYQRLVLKKTQAFHHTAVPFTERKSGANIGLLRAITKFEPERGYRFYTYAGNWIDKGIQKAICEHLGINRGTYDFVSVVGKWRYGFIGSEGREPKRDELKQVLKANEKKIPLSRIDELLDHYYHLYPASLNKKVFDDEEKEVVEGLSDQSDTEASALELHTRNTLYMAMNQELSPDEKDMLASLFGLGGIQKKSLAQIAQEKGMEVAEVNALCEQAQRKLRENKTLKAERYDTEKPIIIIPSANNVIFSNDTKALDEKDLEQRLDEARTIKEKVFLLKKAGWKNEKIVQRFGYTSDMVRRYIYKLRKEGKLSSFQQEKAFQLAVTTHLRNQGKNASYIASILGTTESTVSRLIQKKSIQLSKVVEREREAAKSKLTERVKKYVEDHPPQSRFKNKRGRRPETITFDTQVLAFRNDPANLTIAQIAQQLQVPQYRIKNALRRLRAVGELS